MDPDGPGARVGRTLWGVWSYITGAVNRFFRPPVTSDPDRLQEPAADPGSQGVACGREAAAEQLLPVSSLLGSAKPAVAWEHGTTDDDDAGGARGEGEQTKPQSSAGEKQFTSTGSDVVTTEETEMQLCTLKDFNQEEEDDMIEEEEEEEEEVESRDGALQLESENENVDRAADAANEEENRDWTVEMKYEKHMNREADAEEETEEQQKKDETTANNQIQEEEVEQYSKHPSSACSVEAEETEIQLCTLKGFSEEEEEEEVENRDGELQLESENETGQTERVFSVFEASSDVDRAADAANEEEHKDWKVDTTGHEDKERHMNRTADAEEETEEEQNFDETTTNNQIQEDEVEHDSETKLCTLQDFIQEEEDAHVEEKEEEVENRDGELQLESENEAEVDRAADVDTTGHEDKERHMNRKADAEEENNGTMTNNRMQEEDSEMQHEVEHDSKHSYDSCSIEEEETEIQLCTLQDFNQEEEDDMIEEEESESENETGQTERVFSVFEPSSEVDRAADVDTTGQEDYERHMTMDADDAVEESKRKADAEEETVEQQKVDETTTNNQTQEGDGETQREVERSSVAEETETHLRDYNQEEVVVEVSEEEVTSEETENRVEALQLASENQTRRAENLFSVFDVDRDLEGNQSLVSAGDTVSANDQILVGQEQMLLGRGEEEEGGVIQEESVNESTGSSNNQNNVLTTGVARRADFTQDATAELQRDEPEEDVAEDPEAQREARGADVGGIKAEGRADTAKRDSTPEQEMSGEFKNIPLGAGEGRALEHQELKPATREETREGVPEYNNESGPTQRLLEGGDDHEETQNIQESEEPARLQTGRPPSMEEERDSSSSDEEETTSITDAASEESGRVFVTEEEGRLEDGSMDTRILREEPETTEETEDGTGELLVGFEADEASRGRQEEAGGEDVSSYERSVHSTNSAPSAEPDAACRDVEQEAGDERATAGTCVQEVMTLETEVHEMFTDAETAGETSTDELGPRRLAGMSTEETDTRESEGFCPDVLNEEFLDLWLQAALSVEKQLEEDEESNSPESGLVGDTEINPSTAESGGRLDQSLFKQATPNGESQPLKSASSESTEATDSCVASPSEPADVPEPSMKRPEPEPLGLSTETAEEEPVSSDETQEEEAASQREIDAEERDRRGLEDEGVEQTNIQDEPLDVDMSEHILSTDSASSGVETCSESEEKSTELPSAEQTQAPWPEEMVDSPSEGAEPPQFEDQIEVNASMLDFTAQKSRIAVKNPLVRPPKDPRSLLQMPSVEPTPATGPPGRPPGGLGGLGLGIKLPGLGAGFPVLKKTQRVVRDENDPETSPQEPETKPAETDDDAKQDEALKKPKWMPPRHPGFGNPLMSELKTKLKKTTKE